MLRYRLLPVSHDYINNTSSRTSELVPLSVGHRYAKTPSGDILFTIKGQPNHDWVYLKEPGLDGQLWVVHKKSMTTPNFRYMPITEIRIVDGSSGKVFVSTRDQVILNEFMNYWRYPRPFKLQLGPGTRGVHIQLLSPVIPGMAYEDEVDFTPPSFSSFQPYADWVQMGPKFTKWVIQASSKVPH